LAKEFASKNVQRQCVFKFVRAKNLWRAHVAKATSSPHRGLSFEDDFGRVERTPLAGGGMICRRAADKFVIAIGFSDQADRAEMANGFNG